MARKDERDLYNIVTIKNIDNEDFIFHVDSQPYMIPAGQTHNFPRFMARLAVKHLIDKILNKADKKGVMVANMEERQKVADQVVVSEQLHQRPVTPSDEEVVEEMNKPSDIDDVLSRNKQRLHETAPAKIDPVGQQAQQPGEDKDDENFVGLKEGEDDSSEPAEPSELDDEPAEEVATTDTDQQTLPTREEMIDHAKNVLKLDVTDPKTLASWATMSDQALFEELQMDEM